MALAAQRLGLSHVVVTSVARDDLPEGGALQFARVIQALRRELPGTTVEVLTPDFKGDPSSIETVVAAGPDIFNHNLETVARLQKRVRPYARYERSLGLLREVKRLSPRLWTKSGLMVGLGENTEEVIQAMTDLREAGCELLTIGQYLQSERRNLPVASFVPPETFKWYETEGTRLGFSYVFSGPFVRSSYLADRFHVEMKKRKEPIKHDSA